MEIENTITLDDITRGQIIGARMAFKNYTAFTNPNREAVKSIFAATPLEGNLSGLTFSGCGDLNPLQNDIPHNVIKEGCRVLINGIKCRKAKPDAFSRLQTDGPLLYRRI